MTNRGEPAVAKVYDKQQPRQDVATSHNAFRVIVTTEGWEKCLCIRLRNLRGIEEMVKQAFFSCLFNLINEKQFWVVCKGLFRL